MPLARPRYVASTLAGLGGADDVADLGVELVRIPRSGSTNTGTSRPGRCRHGEPDGGRAGVDGARRPPSGTAARVRRAARRRTPGAARSSRRRRCGVALAASSSSSRHTRELRDLGALVILRRHGARGSAASRSAPARRRCVRPVGPAAAGAAGCGGGRRCGCRRRGSATAASTSATRIRPSGPVPVRSARSTPLLASQAAGPGHGGDGPAGAGRGLRSCGLGGRLLDGQRRSSGLPRPGVAALGLGRSGSVEQVAEAAAGVLALDPADRLADLDRAGLDDDLDEMPATGSRPPCRPCRSSPRRRRRPRRPRRRP